MEKSTTEQLRSEIDKLNNTIADLKNIYDISPGLICVANANDGIFTDCNPAVTSILGWSVKEFTSKPFNDFIHPDDQQKTVDVITEQLKGAPVANFENRYRCKDGSYKWLAWQATAVDKNGKVYAVATDITYRKQAEEELKNSENRLNWSEEIGKIGNWEYEISTNIISWSKQVFKLYERNPKMGPPSDEEVTNYYSDQDHKRLRGYMQKILETGKSIENYECPVNLPSGKTIICAGSMFPVTDNKGKTIKIFGFLQDITDRKQAEDIVRKSKETTEKYLNIAAEIILSLDTNGNITLLNDSGYKLLGYKRGSLIGKNWFNTCLHKEIKEEVGIVFESLMNKNIENIVNYENTVITKNGIEKTIYWHNAILIDNNDNIVGLLSSGEDITKQKKAEKSLKESEMQFRQLADYTYDWEYMIKPNGKYLYLSPSCERITGYNAKEFMSNKNLLAEITKPDYSEKVHAHFKDESSSENPIFTMEIPIITKNGEERWLEHNCTPIFDKDGNYMGRRGNNQDITDRKQSEKTLKSRLNELEIWHDVTVDRELKMLELKKEINELLEKLHKNPKYKIPI